MRIAFGWTVIGTACSDQMAIQRFLSTRDDKTARRVMLVTAIAATMMARRKGVWPLVCYFWI